jgi:hypothetical protein
MGSNSNTTVTKCIKSSAWSETRRYIKKEVFNQWSTISPLEVRKKEIKHWVEEAL